MHDGNEEQHRQRAEPAGEPRPCPSRSSGSTESAESTSSHAVPAPSGPGDHGESIIALSDWLDTAPGRYVLAWEQDEFDKLVVDLFGFRAVQVGLLRLPALRANRMPFLFAAVEPYESAVPEASPLPKVVTRLEELPFAAHSLDLLVLPHALEFAEDPHQVLREVERVLIPEGHVVISGFNPHSLWGLRQLAGRVLRRPFLPDAGQFLTLARLKDWLKLLGFEVDRGHFGCYRPPFRSEKWLARSAFFERAGRRSWTIFGSVYMVSAVKRVRGMRLIGAPWREARTTRSAARPATAQSSTSGPVTRGPAPASSSPSSPAVGGGNPA